MKKISKKLQAIKEKIENKNYTLEEALDFILENNPVEFDATVELHINLNLKKGKDKANFRILISPPNPLAKSPKIAVIAKKSNIKEHDVETGQEKILKQIKSGKIDFDILVCEKDLVEKISPFSKILGPKGLMPQEKNQTLTEKPKEIVEKILKGQREIKADDQDLVHIPIGKISLGKEKLMENLRYILEQVKHNKPAGIKGEFIKRAYFSSTMGPSIKIDLRKTK